MKLSKKLEAEIRKLYEVYWDSYIAGDLRTYASLLDEEFRFIGSTEAEPLLDKKQSIKLLDAVKEQIAGKAEFRNRNIKVELIDELILVSELCDGYILVGKEWTFYSRFRLSSLLKKKRNGWKFIHQHVSMPDSKAQEGEAYGLELIRTENIQLREAVRRRTAELEYKNRELEIESALERVRVAAMGMKKPEDMLRVSSVISEQLELLGTKNIRNVQIVIFNARGTIYLDYEYYPLNDKSVITEVDYLLQPDVKAFAKKMMKAPDTFYTRSFKGPALKKWNRYQKKTNQVLDPRQHKATALHFYFYSIGVGALGISVFAPLTKDEINIFKRFRNVFELAYKRFTDIQKAEAQAREARIEAALERVRSRSMAMHKTDELLDAAEIVHKELSALGLSSMNVSYAFVSEDEKYGSYYSINPVDGRIVPIPFVFPHTETKEMRSILTSWKKKESVHVIELNEKATLKHQTYIGQHIQQQLAKNNIPFSIKDFLKVSPKKQCSLLSILRMDIYLI